MKRFLYFLAIVPWLQSVANADAPSSPNQSRATVRTIEAVDHSAQIAAFIADPDGKQSHDFPAWNGYRKIVGEDKPSRWLFIEMLKVEPQLCGAIGGDPMALNSVLDDRAKALSGTVLRIARDRSGRTSRGGSPLLGSTAAIVFALTERDAKLGYERYQELGRPILGIDNYFEN
jgi:hypothetical protein